MCQVRGNYKGFRLPPLFFFHLGARLFFGLLAPSFSGSFDSGLSSSPLISAPLPVFGSQLPGWAPKILGSTSEHNKNWINASWLNSKNFSKGIEDFWSAICFVFTKITELTFIICICGRNRASTLPSMRFPSKGTCQKIDAVSSTECGK